MSLAQDIIDRITDAVEAIDLPEHTTIKYRRPKSILPEECPMLVVWLRAKTPTPVTTQWFDGTYTIGISWHQDSVDESETQEMDDDLSLDLMDRIGEIEAAIRGLSVTGWDLEDAWELLPGETVYGEPFRDSGVTEGYSLDVLVRVTESG